MAGAILQNDCGNRGEAKTDPAPTNPKAILMHRFPSAGFGGIEHTDGLAGQFAKAGPGPLGAQQPVRLCKCPPREGDGWRWGLMRMDC